MTQDDYAARIEFEGLLECSHSIDKHGERRIGANTLLTESALQAERWGKGVRRE